MISISISGVCAREQSSIARKIWSTINLGQFVTSMYAHPYTLCRGGKGISPSEEETSTIKSVIIVLDVSFLVLYDASEVSRYNTHLSLKSF